MLYNSNKKCCNFEIVLITGEQKDFLKTSICTPVASSLLISLGHSPRLGGTSSHLGGTAPECPPVAPGLAQSNLIVLWDFTNNFVCVIFIVVCVLIRITNKNERRSIKVLKMKKNECYIVYTRFRFLVELN